MKMKSGINYYWYMKVVIISVSDIRMRLIIRIHTNYEDGIFLYGQTVVPCIIINEPRNRLRPTFKANYSESF